jgi:hypothetical protein
MKRAGVTKNELSQTADVLADAIDKDASLIDPQLAVGSFSVEKSSTTTVNNGEPTLESVQKRQTDEDANETAKMAEEIRKAQVGNTLLDPGDLEGFSPDIHVTPRKDGFSAKDLQDQFSGFSSSDIAHTRTIDSSGQPDMRARPATKLDIAKLDESMIMSMPFIKASDNIIPAILFLKPKDPVMRFHWVNFKNWEGGNYRKYRAYGFVDATAEDVDIDITPIGEDCLQGSGIVWYDVKLMKINVFKLMSLYKRNIMSSLKMVGRFHEQARSMAQKQFDNDIHNGLVDSGPNKGMSLLTAFNRMRQAGYNVEFYVPGLEEIVQQDKTFLQDNIAR